MSRSSSDGCDESGAGCYLWIIGIRRICGEDGWIGKSADDGAPKWGPTADIRFPKVEGIALLPSRMSGGMMTQIEQARREDSTLSTIALEAQSTTAGWYPDPGSTPQLRWWDGRSWTGHVRPLQASLLPGQLASSPVLPGQLVSSAGPERAFVGGTGNSMAPALQFQSADDPAEFDRAPISMMGVRPKWVASPAPRRTGTGWVWFLSFFPLIWLGTSALIDLTVVMITGGSIPIGFAVPVLLVTAIATQCDYLALKRRGFDRPASPFWWLISPLAYLIARTVVLRRAVGRGGSPLWWHLASGTLAIAIVAALVFFVGIAGVPTVAGTPAASTAGIQSAIQAEYISQGLMTVAVSCPETADLSPGAGFDCKILDAAHLDSSQIAHVTIEPDGQTFHYSVGPSVAN